MNYDDQSLSHQGDNIRYILSDYMFSPNQLY